MKELFNTLNIEFKNAMSDAKNQTSLFDDFGFEYSLITLLGNKIRIYRDKDSNKLIGWNFDTAPEEFDDKLECIQFFFQEELGLAWLSSFDVELALEVDDNDDWVLHHIHRDLDMVKSDDGILDPQLENFKLLFK